MSNVIEFPDGMRQQWAILERGLRNKLSDGCNPDEIDHVCMAIKPAFLEMATARHCRVDPTKGDQATVTTVNDWVTGLVYGLLIHLAAREIELFRLRVERGAPQRTGAT